MSLRSKVFDETECFCFILGTKSQVARSPSKKRASFNAGRTRDRSRASSDAEKHLNGISDDKHLSSKITFFHLLILISIHHLDQSKHDLTLTLSRKHAFITDIWFGIILITV